MILLYNKKLTLNYSKLLSFPFIGSIYYRFQYILLRLNLISIIYISRKGNINKSFLFKYIDKNFTLIICNSYKIHSDLCKFHIPVILNIKNTKIKNLTVDEKYDLMWVLVHSNYISLNTKKSLEGFIPQNYPLKHIIVIPINDPLDVLCDYITQSAKTLAKKGDITYLIAKGNQINIFKYLFLKKFPKKIFTDYLPNIPNLQIIYPIYIFPRTLHKIHIIERIDNKIYKYLISRFILLLNPDILWTFDSLDLDLVKSLKGKVTTLYDCVDYFSTLEPKLNNIIQQREKELIKSVNYFFVNSHALANTRGKIRNPDAIVPQGFDLKSFTDKSALSKKEKQEIVNIENTFKKIPKPIVGYIGNLTYRINFELLYNVIKFLPKVSFVITDTFLAMPSDDRFVNTQAKLNELKNLPNLCLITKTNNRKVLKEIVKHFDIGIIPYDIKYDFNKYCYPMKLFEYFYCKIPVISTPIEELYRFPKYIKIGKSAKQWETHIKILLSKTYLKKHKEQQKKLAEKNSWDNKIKTISLMLDRYK